MCSWITQVLHSFQAYPESVCRQAYVEKTHTHTMGEFIMHTPCKVKKQRENRKKSLGTPASTRQIVQVKSQAKSPGNNDSEQREWCKRYMTCGAHSQPREKGEPPKSWGSLPQGERWSQLEPVRQGGPVVEDQRPVPLCWYLWREMFHLKYNRSQWQHFACCNGA